MNDNNKDKPTGSRRQHSVEEKVRLLRLHLLEGKAISAICEEQRRRLPSSGRG